MDTLNTNREIGIKIERLVNKIIQGDISNSQPHPCDITTTSELIEVKGARLKCKFRCSKSGKQYFRNGRFLINVSSHNKLLKIAEEKSKTALYIFAIYSLINNEPSIEKMKTYHWIDVELLIKNSPFYLRKSDNTTYSIISYTSVFGDKHVL